MKLMKRNLRPIHYCLYQGQQVTYDEDNNETGEPNISYAAPVKLDVNISPASGYTNIGMFGNLTDYDKVILTDKMDCPINENTLLFVDTAVTGNPDYKVRKVAKSLNHISYAVSEIKTTLTITSSVSNNTQSEEQSHEEENSQD